MSLSLRSQRDELQNRSLELSAQCEALKQQVLHHATSTRHRLGTETAAEEGLGGGSSGSGSGGSVGGFISLDERLDLERDLAEARNEALELQRELARERADHGDHSVREYDHDVLVSRLRQEP